MKPNFPNRTPKVSVIIPLYETERFIALTIASVAAQSFTDFEILVIDDGSKDKGPAIAAAFGDSRLRVISQINRGLAGARNTGICEARGEYLAFLDADDLWHPEKLAAHVEMLDANANIGVSFSCSRMIDDEGRDIGMVQRPAAKMFDAAYVFCRNPVGNGSAPVIRRKTLDDIAFHDCTQNGRLCWFDESFRQSEDIECWTRIATQGLWEFGLIDRELTLYRVSSMGLSANLESQLATWRRFRAKVAAYAPELNNTAGNLAEAFQLRYLARRAVKSINGQTALRLIVHALWLDARIIIREPSRTLQTLAAALLICAVPKSLIQFIEKAALKAVGQAQMPDARTQ